MPHRGQNACGRTTPLSDVLRYSVGLPDRSTNVPGRVLMIARSGAPLIVWQSVQLQSVVVSGSASGFERHVSTVTTSVDFHAFLLPSAHSQMPVTTPMSMLSGLIVMTMPPGKR